MCKLHSIELDLFAKLLFADIVVAAAASALVKCVAGIDTMNLYWVLVSSFVSQSADVCVYRYYVQADVVQLDASIDCWFWRCVLDWTGTYGSLAQRMEGWTVKLCCLQAAIAMWAIMIMSVLTVKLKFVGFAVTRIICHWHALRSHTHKCSVCVNVQCSSNIFVLNFFSCSQRIGLSFVEQCFDFLCKFQLLFQFIHFAECAKALPIFNIYSQISAPITMIIIFNITPNAAPCQILHL